MVFDHDTSEKIAAQCVGLSPSALARKRRGGVIPNYIYIKLGYKTVRYCLPLLRDWALAPDDLKAQARAREALAATRPSNLPRKRGPKTAF